MWEVIRQAEEIRIVDPEGTDLTRTWHEEYWQIVEGSHPTIKTVGENFGGYAAGQKIGATYGPGQSEQPMIRIHITGVPQGIVLTQSNGGGCGGKHFRSSGAISVDKGRTQEQPDRGCARGWQIRQSVGGIPQSI